MYVTDLLLDNAGKPAAQTVWLDEGWGGSGMKTGAMRSHKANMKRTYGERYLSTIECIEGKSPCLEGIAVPKPDGYGNDALAEPADVFTFKEMTRPAPVPGRSRLYDSWLNPDKSTIRDTSDDAFEDWLDDMVRRASSGLVDDEDV